ncbi:MAG: alpha/beta hydrolase [Treponema sp.]|nr:alpha/beta hydrolase [Treponema sp.]
MNYREYGKGHAEHIILLHGGGLSWWNYRTEAELLEDTFHVILPVLDGHAGSGRPFTSIEDNAAEIVAFIDGELGGSVALIGGLSLGAQVLLAILAGRGDICRAALVESACVIPSPLACALAGPALGMSYGLIRNRRFSRLQFSALHIREDLFGDYFRDSCLISREDMTAFLRASSAFPAGESLWKPLAGCRARVQVVVGGWEDRRMLRSAGLIQEMIPGSALEVLPGLHHGGLSLNRPAEYAARIRGMLGEA